MNSFLFSINAVMPLFLLILLGYTLKRIGFFTEEWLKSANKFSFRVTLSTLIFHSIYTADTSMNINPKLILLIVTGISVIYLLSFMFVPLIVKNRFQTGVAMQGIFRSNFLLFGMPLVVNMFGEEAKPLTAIIAAIVIPLYNFLAVITLTIFNKNSDGKINIPKLLKGIFTNPLIVGSLIGFLFRLVHLKLPGFLLHSIGDIADIAVPFALVILGAQFKFKGFLKNIKIVVPVVLTKIVICSTIMVVVAILAGLSGIEVAIIMVIFGAPCAVSSSIMAYSMNCDGDLAGHIVVLGTFVSIFTIFITIYVLNLLSIF